MPVGAGSIKRAAKLNADAEAKVSVKEEAVKEPVTPKKTKIAKEPATAKKAETVKKASEQQVSGNQVCHLTEELPVYLL